ncbi:MAG: exosortase B [Rubrivivax sp.]|nr:exosortase B [Rubrivivax sp.]
MTQTVPHPLKPAPAPRLPLLPAGFDWPVFGMLLAGFALLYVPTWAELARTIWATDEQGHGPIILAVSAWLLYGRRHDIAAAAQRPLPWLGWPVFVFAMLLFAFGSSQDIIMFQTSSQILVLASLLLIFRGGAALKAAFFPLFFLIFMIPLPEALVAAVTSPLKSAVSAVASSLLYNLGYPVGRAGVIMTVGPYQLLVADACAGLNSMFTLEALGLLYMNLMGYTSLRRNVALAVLLIPIAFAANIVRVMILVLVTYHFGDEAGQGFIHSFAGMVLFMVGLALMLVTDKVLGTFLPGVKEAK